MQIDLMRKQASICSEAILNHSEALVVSHIDADGLTSAAIICRALERAGIEYSTRFVKQLDIESLKSIVDMNPPMTVFTDLGSGMLDAIANFKIDAAVIDHHQPSGTFKYHLNPHLFGINGSLEISGSGTAYITALALGDNNQDLADLAIVGAVGDLQHIKHSHLVGVNREILNYGVESQVIEFQKDLQLFGRQTRPVYKLLQYSSDPFLPGITGNEDACIDFLKNLGIRLQGERWRRWIDLIPEEKQKIVSALIQHCISTRVPPYKIQRLVGEVYTLLREQEGTEVRDASEFSTLLNATARYDFADVGLAVALGDRSKQYNKAAELLENHRKNLIEGLNFVREHGVIELKNIQYFDAGNRIRETIVGIVAGMVLSTAKEIPIIAFADAEGGVKVSARGTQDIIRRGVNLGAAMSETSKSVGGAGGGHDIAAGAFIPKDAKAEFIERLDMVIGMQMKQ